MNMEGMLALLRVVEKIDYKKMNMAAWFAHKGRARFPKGKVPHAHNGRPTLGCGTSACWLGQASIDRTFSKVTGIKLEQSTNGSLYPTIYGAYGMQAAEVGLELTHRQAEYLFGPAQSGKKEDLIRRWWEVVRGTVY